MILVNFVLLYRIANFWNILVQAKYHFIYDTYSLGHFLKISCFILKQLLIIDCVKKGVMKFRMQVVLFNIRN